MPSYRTFAIALFLPLLGATLACAQTPEWFTVATPGQASLHRADVGLLGQDEATSTLVDLAARGGSYTGINLVYQHDETSLDSLQWRRPNVEFHLETAIEALPGLVFGLDATDDYPKTRATIASDKWQLFDPQGGLRLGGALDLLRSWRQESAWRWVVAGWIPVFSQAREAEVRTGLIWARKLRMDVSASWISSAVAARWTALVDSSLAEDTLWWRADQFRWEARLGGAFNSTSSLQAWMGQRRLTDPGAGDQPSWRTWGNALFGGVQGTFQTGPLGWDLEFHSEQGTQSQLCDGSPRFANLPDSGKVRGEVDFQNGSVRAKSTFPWSDRWRFDLELSGAWMDLEHTTMVGTPLRPASAATGDWATTKRYSSRMSSTLTVAWLDLTATAGLQLRLQAGSSQPIWQGLAPQPPGRSWSLPLGVGLSRRGANSGKVSYGMSGELTLGGGSQAQPGLRHHLEMKQGF